MAKVNISQWDFVMACLDKPTPMIIFPSDISIDNAGRDNNMNIWVTISGTGSDIYDGKTFRGILDTYGTNEDCPTLWDAESPRSCIVLNGARYERPKSNGSLQLIKPSLVALTDAESKTPERKRDMPVRATKLIKAPKPMELVGRKDASSKQEEESSSKTDKEASGESDKEASGESDKASSKNDKEAFRASPKNNQAWMQRNSLDTGTVIGIGVILVLGLVISVIATKNRCVV